MPGTPVPAALIGELQRQLNHEYGAAHAYAALAIWCADQNLKGFARYFHKQSAEEREHAQRLVDHLIARGVMPEVSALQAPRTRFESLLDVARHAQSMEQANTAGILQAYKAALKEGDLPAQVALQWFISEQVEEESWCDEMVDRVEAASRTAAFGYLDRHIETLLAEKAHPEGGNGGD